MLRTLLSLSSAPTPRSWTGRQATRACAPIASVDELRADVFESDKELEEFLAA